MVHLTIFFIKLLCAECINQGRDGIELLCHGLGDLFGHDDGDGVGATFSQNGLSKPNGCHW